ncbi:uncharacterized protein LOC107811610 [Nicotiana tabacum]|uniref:Uncharacterized protein LOC107811610 n=1 Tax=Nicotiana tabacum TaxID=4097 RepID=A0A1S4BT52_TOBAC|nr:uncharacterized protein LOC104110226 [Nicotiana tomentosiformis]XP_016492064.1 PREDICTED: uncharacterized protein LOC107811610 [Nicotiana tabacum]
MAAHRRLLTRDRLIKWGVVADKTCPLCNLEDESIEHVFFKCEISTQIWKHILQWQGIKRDSKCWDEELTWVVQNASGKSPGAAVYRMLLSAIIYYIWNERNQRVFTNKQQGKEVIIKKIVQDVHHRGAMKQRIAKWLEQLNFYPL